MPDRTPWWRLGDMAESDWGHSWLVKLVIVTVVFPTQVLTLMQPWNLVLLGLAWLLPINTQWAQWVGWCATIVGVILAGYGALDLSTDLAEADDQFSCVIQRGLTGRWSGPASPAAQRLPVRRI